MPVGEGLLLCWVSEAACRAHMSRKDQAVLLDLEERLSLSDVAHFRMGEWQLSVMS